MTSKLPDLPDLPDLPAVRSHTRREFMSTVAGGVVSLRTSPVLLQPIREATASRHGRSALQVARIRKAMLISMLPTALSYADRFALARSAGFEGIEMQTVANSDEASEIREASKKTGLLIHSVMNADHWRFPLSSGDPEVVARSVAGMETSLRNAALWGADAVLLVPAVVDATTSYADAWSRSQRVIASGCCRSPPSFEW